MCIWDLQCFQSYPNCNLFCTFFLLRNFCSGDAPHGNDGKHCLTHHFQHCAHSVYEICSIFKVFEIAVCFAHFAFFEIWTPLWQTLFKSSFPTLSTQCISDLQYFETFRNCCLFCTVWLIRNLNCADSHHNSYGERCSNHHFQHCAQCVYEIYSVFKVFEIPVCFAHFGLFEILTPVRGIMLTIANIVQIIISNIADTVYIRLTTFWTFSKLQLVLHILPFTKFLLRRCATC